MSNDAFLVLDLRPDMTIAQLCDLLMDDFEKTGLKCAEFDIPGIDVDGKKSFLLNFEIKLITPNERKS